jgi:hypothetical protein
VNLIGQYRCMRSGIGDPYGHDQIEGQPHGHRVRVGGPACGVWRQQAAVEQVRAACEKYVTAQVKKEHVARPTRFVAETVSIDSGGRGRR